MIRPEDIFKVLYRYSKIFSYLYEKRDKEVLLSDVLTDEVSLDTLLRYEKDFELLDISKTHIALSDIMVNFLDEALGVPTEIRLGVLNDMLNALEKDIDDYQDERITNKGKILKSMRRNLKRIRTAMIKTLDNIGERVIIEFKSQSDNYKKRKELVHYKSKIIEFSQMRDMVEKILEREGIFFARLGSVEVQSQYNELRNVLYTLSSLIARLQLEVTEYIHKLGGDNVEVKRIIRIGEMIRAQEFREYTNIVELLKKRDFRIAPLDRSGKSSSKKPFTLIDDEVDMQPEYVNAIQALPDDLFDIEALVKSFSTRSVNPRRSGRGYKEYQLC